MNFRAGICAVLSGFFLVLSAATGAFAQHCQPYWTAQYKCAMGCGSCGAGNAAPQPYVASQPSAAQVAAQRATALANKGTAAYAARRWPEAIRLYEQALRLNPSDQGIVEKLNHVRGSILNQQGIDAYKAGNLALAASLFERALPLISTKTPVDKSRVADSLKTVRAQLKQAEAEMRAQKQDAAVVGTSQSTPAKIVSYVYVCPPDLPQVAFNPARLDQPDGHYCIGKNAIACGGPSKSWACEAGRACNGDGSDPKVSLCR